MKVLLDENLPQKLRFAFHAHEVYSAAYLGLSGITNGALVEYAQAHGFDVLVTADQNLRYQQNLTGRSRAMVVLTVNHWHVLQRNLGSIIQAVDRAQASSYQEVLCS